MRERSEKRREALLRDAVTRTGSGTGTEIGIADANGEIGIMVANGEIGIADAIRDRVGRWLGGREMGRSRSRVKYCTTGR